MLCALKLQQPWLHFVQDTLHQHYDNKLKSDIFQCDILLILPGLPSQGGLKFVPSISSVLTHPYQGSIKKHQIVQVKSYLVTEPP